MRERSIYHKNLMPVVYVTADVAGREESPVYPILNMNEKIAEMRLPEGYSLETHTAQQPTDTDKPGMKWDGEWHITYEVFRDLGLAFAAVLILIYILVVAWFQSFKTPLVIMAAIPVFARRHPPRALGLRSVFHRNVHDRIHCRRGNRGAEFDHSRGLYRTPPEHGRII